MIRNAHNLVLLKEMRELLQELINGDDDPSNPQIAIWQAQQAACEKLIADFEREHPMGFHVCEYCPRPHDPRYAGEPPATSSGDVVLVFANGHIYSVPDMITHYVFVHNYQPPAAFVDDVMNGELTDGKRWQSKGQPPEKVGYLHGTYETGPVPKFFVERLHWLLTQADRMGNRMQTRSL